MSVPNAAAQFDAQRRIWIVVECPYCGRRNRHQHGAGADGQDPIAYLGNRVADCGGVCGTYNLVDAGEVPTPIHFDRKATAAAAKASGLDRRSWDRDYRGRTTPLSEAELRARGDDIYDVLMTGSSGSL
jgi:hypothetical protein